MSKNSPQLSPALGAWPAAAFMALAPALAAGGAMGLPAAMALCAGLAVLLSFPFRALTPGSAPHWAFLAVLAALLAWVSASAFWSPYQDHSQVWRLWGGVLAGLAVVPVAGADPPSRRLVRAAGAACVAVLAGLLLIEAFADMPLNRLAQPEAETGMLMRNPARATTVLVCLVWGAVGALAGGSSFERMAWRALLAAVGILSLQFDMAANAAAFGAGLVGYAAARMAPRFAIMAMCAALAAWLLAAPWVIPSIFSNESLVARLPDSWAMRVEIWRFTIEHIREQPWIGWGLDASRTFPETSEIRGIPFSLIPLHPHSASLQVWLETGAVGAGLGAAALMVGGWALSGALARNPGAAGAAGGVIGVCAVIDNVSFGAWQEWWIATTFAGAALAAAAFRGPAPAAADP